jgi:glutamate synthase domain-containing protein 3
MGESLKTLDCSGQTVRQINQFLKEAATHGPDTAVTIINPDSRHNIAVGVTQPLDILIEGNVGYYCAGLCDGLTVKIAGDTGWGLAENMMSGSIVVTGSAGSSAGATMRGGRLVIHGDSGARCGIAMKGGTIIVGGNAGYMTGFMMQKGSIIVFGDAGEALGDSLYEGKLYVRGSIKSLGSDAVEDEMNDDDIVLLAAAIADLNADAAPLDFKKIGSGKKLYNFNTKEKEIWKLAL